MYTCPPMFVEKSVKFEDSNGFPFTLLEKLTYVSRVFCTFTVPAGFKTDLASIPRLLWNILPPVGAYDRAAVVHDYVYQSGHIYGKPVSRKQADDMLLEGMELLKVSAFQRRAIYAGVRLGGWVPWRRYRRRDIKG